MEIPNKFLHTLKPEVTVGQLVQWLSDRKVLSDELSRINSEAGSYCYEQMEKLEAGDEIAQKELQAIRQKRKLAQSSLDEYDATLLRKYGK